MICPHCHQPIAMPTAEIEIPTDCDLDATFIITAEGEDPGPDPLPLNPPSSEGDEA